MKFSIYLNRRVFVMNVSGTDFPSCFTRESTFVNPVCFLANQAPVLKKGAILKENNVLLRVVNS